MPPSRKYSDPDAIAKVADLTLRSRRLVEGAINGQHRSPFHGFNIEFAQYRDYTPGDDLRRLDWRVFARSDRHYIKQYEEESNVKVTFVVDASASMNYKGSADALEVRLRGHDGRRPGHAPDPPARPRRPRPLRRGGQHHAAARRQAVAGPGDLGPAPEDARRPARPTSAACSRSITNQGKRRGLMVIVSDLLTDLDTVYDGLNRLRFLGHEVLVMQVLDRDEMELPFDGPTIFTDIEGDEEVFAEPWAFRRSYQAAMNEFLDGVKKECGARGYDHVRFLTDEPLGDSLSLFLHSRDEVGRGGQAIMMTFLSPLLAWGALLGAIPIIIHLLNRRRFRRVDWAPMRYLKLTVQRNRRRVQIEQLLLMLLRVAALALLFFYLARPVINPTGLEGWLGSGGRSSQIVLIDDSLSMGYGSSESPAFRQAKETAGSLGRLGPKRGPIHDPGRLGSQGPGGPRGRRLAARGPGRGGRDDPADGRACRLAGGPGRGRGGPPVVHLSDPAGHDPDRPPQVGLGRRGLADRPEVVRGRRPGPDLRRRLGRRRQRRACWGSSRSTGRSSPGPRAAGRR